MTENEPRNKIWIGRNPKVTIGSPYEMCELSAGIQVGFETIVDAKTLMNWYTDNRSVIDDVLNDQEVREYLRRGQAVPKRLDKYVENAVDSLPLQTEDKPETDEIVVVHSNEEIKIPKETVNTPTTTEVMSTNKVTVIPKTSEVLKDFKTAEPESAVRPRGLRVIKCKSCKSEVQEYQSKFQKGGTYFRCNTCKMYLDEFGNKEVKKSA